MEHIIQQIASKAIKNIFEYYERNGLQTLSKMTEELRTISDEMVREMLCAFINEADKALCEAKKERKLAKLQVHEKNVERTVFTTLGNFTYKRTYFDMPEGKHTYLLDRILGVEDYDRIETGISAKLVNAAAERSYGQSAAEITGGQISRQSVRNKMMETGEVAHIPFRKNETPETLHIFADEDHVHLQDGNGTILPLITICGGKREISKERNELIDPVHVHGYGIKPETQWEYVYALCEEMYDMEKVKEVYLYGDGAGWILRGLEYFPNGIHILDEFHYLSKMKRLFAGELCGAYRLQGYTAVSRNDSVGFGKIVDQMIETIREQMREGKEREHKIKTIRECGGYMLAHWKAIQNKNLEKSIGSCTEAMVSHVFSSRFSRNPMGWSREGLSKMAMIRVFVLNGGEIRAADIRRGKSGRENKRGVIKNIYTYEEVIKKQQDKILKGAKDWGWLEHEHFGLGKRTGTKVALDLLGKMRNIS